MGQRQNKTEIEYGNDCLTCFAEGKTPKYVYARFSRVKKCDTFECQDYPSPPNDRVFKLTQVVDSACTWRFEDDDWQVSYYAVMPPTYGAQLVVLYKPDWTSYFNGTTLPGDECATFFTNEDTCAEGECGIGGNGVVTWRLESLKIMGLLNIKVQGDLFMEMRPLENGHRIYKYCKISQGMNIAIKYDPD